MQLFKRTLTRMHSFAEVWASQRDFAEKAVPFWSGAQSSNAKLGLAFAKTLK
jgi:hypothetical protein